MTNQPKIIVVIGPTASGKSEYAVKLAKKYNGEIISADSRQVYKGLDIGTGKVPGHWVSLKNRGRGRSGTGSKVFVYKDIPHHCIDYISPKKQYAVTDFKCDAELAIEDIISRGKTPIICGGTGLYVDAVLFNQSIPEVEPDPAYRKKLEAKSTAQLFALLSKRDPVRARTIDAHNPRRLIRALEIIHATGKPVPPLQATPNMTYMTYKSNTSHTTYNTHGPNTLRVEIHYLQPARAVLYKKIEKRLNEWLKKELLFTEIKKLRADGVTWKRIMEFGLEYKYASEYLRGKIDYPTMYAQSLKSIQQYAKRQETWFKKYEPHTVQ